MDKPSYYAIIPASIRYDNSISANAKLLFGEITALCGSQGNCWAGNKYFSDLYQVSKGTISRYMSQLQKANHIKVDLIYKPGTNQIMKRSITITPIVKNEYTYDQNCVYPIRKNDKDNNTSINITSINKEVNQLSVDWDRLKQSFITATGKEIRVVSDKVKRNVKTRLKEGYTREMIVKCFENSIKDEYHVETGFRYITLEYCTRSQSIDKYQDSVKAETVKQTGKFTR